MNADAAQSALTACDYCGLPLPASAASPAYCCFGCRFAAAMGPRAGTPGWNKATLARLAIAIFFTLNVVMFTMVLWSPDVYGTTADTPFDRILQSLLRYLCALLALPVLWLLGLPLLENAWVTLRQGRITTDWLLLAGVVAAYVYSFISTWRESGPVYFEVGCVILLLVTLGRWLEATGKQKALSTLAAMERWLPNEVRLLSDTDERTLPARDVEAGQLLRVVAGERAPVDGIVERQTVAMDEQWLTGESLPASKKKGDTVHGGTLVAEGVLFLRATCRPGEGTFARFLALVRQSLQQKGHYERLADQVTRWFLPLVFAVAATALIWHGWAEGLGAGIMAALGVVLIACPCALGIATPLAIWTAMGQAAGRQIVITSATALESLANVRTIFLDKTGTLTTGTPRLACTTLASNEELEATVNLAGWLAQQSTHPLSRALAASLPGSTQFSGVVRQMSGQGLSAELPCGLAVLGNELAMTSSGALMPPEVRTAIDARPDQPYVLLACAGRVLAAFHFEEALRPEALQSVKGLTAAGLRVEILTGDHARRAAALARQLAIPVRGNLLPEHKVAAVRSATGPVAMVGDGLNDAPALAAADVGIALGCGADLARDSATICLLANDLNQLPWLFALAQRTQRTIRFNLLWALVYNVIGVGMALAGWLNPVWAAVVMTVSSLFVIGNSLRLREAHSVAPLPAATPALEWA